MTTTLRLAVLPSLLILVASGCGGDGGSGAVPDVAVAADLALPRDASVRDLSTVDLRVVDLLPPTEDATPDLGHDVPDLRRDDDLALSPGCDGGVRDVDAGACVACLVDGDCGGGGKACCGRACVDPMTSVSHCGGCGRACAPANATPACRAGGCAIAACTPGYADCNGSAGDGCEISVASDVKNCGACNVACAIPHAQPGCLGGACALASCDPGYRNCDGDPRNGCEIDGNTDPNNCGGCGNSCAQLPHAAASCKAGMCAIGACAMGFGNCDKMDANGCETDVTSSLANCGGCGLSCVAMQLPNTDVKCINSQCIDNGCLKGFADCDLKAPNGCETNLLTDGKNCGVCGVVCGGNAPNAVPACAAGKCGFACNAGWGDCDGNAGNGCEKDVSSDPANCGGCGVACKQGEACVMGLCVSCAAGRYEGPAMATALGVNVSGTISFSLGNPVNNVLTVTKGSLSMTGAMQASATATVTGTLDCNRKAFTGMLTNGVAQAQNFPPTPFTGSLTADYLVNGQSFANGTMSVQGLGNGTWTAAWLGP